MDIRMIDEFRLIDLIKEDCLFDKESVVVGIGDDAAVYRPGCGQYQLLSTDMLVENVHFDLSFMSAQQLGYKALAVNLSDIAAMGGLPKQAVVSLALPKTVRLDFVLDLYKGIKSIAHQFKVNIIGGDTVSTTGPIVINIAVTGEVPPRKLQRRSGACVGDLIAVTGTVGDSAAGLELLQSGLNKSVNFALPLIKAHLEPVPQIEAAQRMNAYATSMNDISDGLANEVSEIAIASGKKLILDERMIPLSEGVRQTAKLFGKAPLSYALYGGEDYELVFTLPKEAAQEISLANEIPVFTVIGEVAEGSAGACLRKASGLVIDLEPQGYNHFR